MPQYSILNHWPYVKKLGFLPHPEQYRVPITVDIVKANLEDGVDFQYLNNILTKCCTYLMNTGYLSPTW